MESSCVESSRPGLFESSQCYERILCCLCSPPSPSHLRCRVSWRWKNPSSKMQQSIFWKRQTWAKEKLISSLSRSVNEAASRCWQRERIALESSNAPPPFKRLAASSRHLPWAQLCSRLRSLLFFLLLLDSPLQFYKLVMLFMMSRTLPPMAPFAHWQPSSAQSSATVC